MIDLTTYVSENDEDLRVYVASVDDCLVGYLVVSQDGSKDFLDDIGQLGISSLPIYSEPLEVYESPQVLSGDDISRLLVKAINSDFSVHLSKTNLEQILEEFMIDQKPSDDTSKIIRSEFEGNCELSDTYTLVPPDY